MRRLLAFVAVAIAACALLLPVSSAGAKQPEQRVTELFSQNPARFAGDLAVCRSSRSVSCLVQARDDAREVYYLAFGNDFHGTVFRSTADGTVPVSVGPGGVANDLGSRGSCGAYKHACLATLLPDGSLVFETRVALTPGDTDQAVDLYMRRNGVTTLLSNFPSGTASALVQVHSADYRHLIFELEDRQSSGFPSPSGYIEVLPDGNWSRFPAGVTAGDYLQFDWESPDLSQIVFTTWASLVPEDRDGGRSDVYERGADGRLRLLSTSPLAPNARVDAQFAHASADGSRVYFSTPESLAPEDANSCTEDWGDGCYDIYLSSGETTKLMTPGTATSNTYMAGETPDGAHFFFGTRDSLTADDGDRCVFSPDFISGCWDTYDRSGGTITLVSVGTPTEEAWFEGSSADGRRTYFSSREPVLPEDHDTCFDVDYDGTRTERGCHDIYQRFEGRTRLVSTGPLEAASPDADTCCTTVAPDGSLTFHTGERLTADAPETGGLYRWRDGRITFVPSPAESVGGLPKDAQVNGKSRDGSRVVFTTAQPLVPQDTDSCEDYYGTGDTGCPDVYELHGGTFTLLSTGPNDPQGSCFLGEGATCPRVVGVSRDATRVLFKDQDPLVATDTDAGTDIYLSRLIEPGCRDKDHGATPDKC